MRLRSGIDSLKPTQAPVNAANTVQASNSPQQAAKSEQRKDKTKQPAKKEVAAEESTTTVGDADVSIVSNTITKAEKKIRKKQRGKKSKAKAFHASLAAEFDKLDDQTTSSHPSLPGKWPKTPPRSYARSSFTAASAGGLQANLTEPSLPGKWPKTPPQHFTNRGYDKVSTGGFNVAKPKNKFPNHSRVDRRFPNNAQFPMPDNSFKRGFSKSNFGPGESVTTEQLNNIKTVFKTIEDEIVAVALVMDKISSSDVALKEDLSNMVWRMYFAYNAAQSINNNYLQPEWS